MIDIKKKLFKNKKFYVGLFSVFFILLLGSGIIYAVIKNNESHEICVAYSTDDNYVYPTVVSMVSLMENARKNTFCKFTVLTSDNVSSENKQKIKSLENDYSNCSVNIVDMGQQFGNSEERFWSKAMYYRLNLPQILENEKRCIYLDSDTMVRKDLSYMFNMDMKDYYIAGIKDYNYYINKDSDHYRTLGIPNLDSYVCSGVLIMNLEKMRNDNLHETLDKLIKENDINKTFKFPDQDALNKACYGHILLLPFKYGALAHTDFSKTYYESEYASWATNIKDWEEGRTNPVVIHFTEDKPWNIVYSDFCKQWWTYANKSPCKEQISEKYAKCANKPS